MKLFIFNNKKKKFELVISQLIMIFLFFTIFYQEKIVVQSITIKMKFTNAMLLTKGNFFNSFFI